MKPESQRIAIAEACGWTECRPRASVTDRPWISGFNPCPERTVAVFNEDGVEMEEPRALDPETLPDYLSDLNAMHEAEKVLPSDRTTEHWHHLFDVVRRHQRSISAPAVIYMVSATAAQRAEAFLRTIGKWEDSK